MLVCGIGDFTVGCEITGVAEWFAFPVGMVAAPPVGVVFAIPVVTSAVPVFDPAPGLGPIAAGGIKARVCCCNYATCCRMSIAACMVAESGKVVMVPAGIMVTVFCGSLSSESVSAISLLLLSSLVSLFLLLLLWASSTFFLGAGGVALLLSVVLSGVVGIG